MICCLVVQSCLILCDAMDCSLPGFFVHGISQARILEWVAISFSRGPSWPKGWTQVSCISDRFFTTELPGKPLNMLLPSEYKWNLQNVPEIFSKLAVLSKVWKEEVFEGFCKINAWMQPTI